MCREHEKVMTYDMRSKIKRKIDESKKNFQTAAKKNGWKDEDSNKFEEDHLAEKLLYSNLETIGQFFQCAAYNEFDVSAPHTIKEDANNDFSRNCMMQVKEMAKDKDETQTKLTTDLYQSHFDTAVHHIQLGTSTLLHLSNALWAFKEQVTDGVDEFSTPDPKKPEFKVYKDLLLDLLYKIQPDKSEVLLAAEKANVQFTIKDRAVQKYTKTKVWDKYYLAYVEKMKVKAVHNFVINPRFLEKHKDLCFCRDCEAPIVRSICPKNMRGRSDVRLITVFKENEGASFESGTKTVYPFLELEAVLSNERVERITQREFALMTTDFDEKQKAIIEKLNQQGRGEEEKAAEHYGTLALLDRARQAIDILKNNGIQEKDYIKYQLDQLEARENHHKYLEKLEEGKQDLDDMRHSYLDTLRRTEELLRTSVIESERVPNKIGTKANEYGLSLKVQSIEVKKKKRRESCRQQAFIVAPVCNVQC